MSPVLTQALVQQFELENENSANGTESELGLSQIDLKVLEQAKSDPEKSWTYCRQLLLGLPFFQVRADVGTTPRSKRSAALGSWDSEVRLWVLYVMQPSRLRTTSKRERRTRRSDAPSSL